MKPFCFLLFVLFLLSNTNAQETSKPAADVLQDAYRVATKESKKVFIIFHASWCGWCRKMDAALNDKAVKKFFDDQYVIRHLTVLESNNKKNLENPGAEAVYTKYGGENQGLPYWLIFDASGNLLADSQMRPEGAGLDTEGRNAGCPANTEELAHFMNVLRKTSSLTEAQLAKIEKRFRKHADSPYEEED